MSDVIWIELLARCEGKVDARETAIGYVPYAKDINIEGLDITEDTVNELLSVDNEAWLADVENIKEFYDMIGGTVLLRTARRTFRSQGKTFKII